MYVFCGTKYMYILYVYKPATKTSNVFVDCVPRDLSLGEEDFGSDGFAVVVRSEGGKDCCRLPRQHHGLLCFVQVPRLLSPVHADCCISVLAYRFQAIFSAVGP